jgi:phospholipid/cholesterol/gamma-HCH transport system permease protein
MGDHLIERVAVRRSPEGLHLELTGELRLTDLPSIEHALDSVDLQGVRRVYITTAAMQRLDLSVAARLHAFIERAHASGAEVRFEAGEPHQLRLLQKLAEGEGPPAPLPVEPEAPEPVAALGRHIVRRWRDVTTGLAFLGHVAALAVRAGRSMRSLRPVSVMRHIYDTGITAIPIVSLIAFLISVIIAYMSAQQLERFGAEIFVVDLVTIGVLRELGVLLTAIIVAGRSGSAFAAEIGAMCLNEEVDALHATGVEPIEVLVLPRIVGLVIALPLLTIIADAIGLLGGAILCHFLLDMSVTQYFDRVDNAIAPTTFWAGLVKAPVFALLIAMAGTYRGMQVRSSSRELGRLTTVAVVQAIFLVILADALFAVLFMEIDF